MGDAGVDRNHQVKLRDQGGGIGKARKFGIGVENIAPLAKHEPIAGASVLLQADEPRLDV